MAPDKIEDNPSYKDFKKKIEQAETTYSFLKYLSNFGLNIDGLEKAFEKVPEMKKQLEILSTGPDKFNKHFSQLGWIAHESMNHELMINASNLAEEGLLDKAEHELIEYYTSNKIKFLIQQCNFTKGFEERFDLIELAYEDTLNKRYYACIPILLMVIDGTVNDVDGNKGFFSDNSDLMAWDSIAAHSSGLTVLRDLFIKTRNKTTTEKLILPYRNGIMHGRDLGYANEIVAAKCWAALFAIKDWIKCIEEGKKSAPKIEPEPELSFGESLRQLKELGEKVEKNKKRFKEIDRKVKEWKAREIMPGIDVPESGNSNDYKEYSPEWEAIKFVEYWMNNNFGAIAKQIHNFTKKEINYNKVAGEIRKELNSKKLNSYKIVKIVDCSPKISEITLLINFEFENSLNEKEIKMRMIYEDPHDELILHGEPGGQWKFVNYFYNNI